jgi:hypothetical protein
MRASVFLAILLVVGAIAHEAAAQSGDIHCPTPGSRFTFSDGGRIEAVADEGNDICRFRSLKTFKTFDRLFGVFLPTGPNAQQIRSLAPFAVGHKVSFTNSGADVLGGDGFWFHDVAIERFENVTTTAGTFGAFVILYDDQSMQSSHGRWQRRFWYSPDVSQVVKFEFLTLNGSPPPNYPKSWELTAYEPGAPLPAVAHPKPMAVPASPPPLQTSLPLPVSKPVQPPAPATTPAAAPTKVAHAVMVPSALDGAWEMDMEVTTTYGTTVGGECQTQPRIPLTFVNGNDEGPAAKLHLTADGRISGWMAVPFLGTSMLPFLVNVSGRLEDGAFTGSVSGRCIGSFTMRRQ